MKTKRAQLIMAALVLSATLSPFAAAATAGTTPAPARLISTDGFVTDLLFSLDADEQLIGVDVTSTLPNGYRALPNIGYHRSLSAEGLLNLRPSQVIGSELMGPPAVVSALKQANISVTQLPTAHTAEQLKANITTLAKVVAREAKAKVLLAGINSELAELKQQPLRQMRVAVLLSTDPVKLRLAGRGTNGDAFVQLLQAKNVAQFKNYQNVSAESLLSLQPELIVVIGRDHSTAAQELMAAHPILKNTPAAAQSRVIAIDGAALIAGLSPAAISQALSLTKRIRRELVVMSQATQPVRR